MFHPHYFDGQKVHEQEVVHEVVQPRNGNRRGDAHY